MLPTIAWDGDDIVMIDQRKLPGREVYVRCRSGYEVAKAITTMVIRGAPAIGVAAAMGLALGAQVASALAAGARARYGADIGIGITGIAGPGGGTPDKPVGTVCLCLATADDSEARTVRLPGSRCFF